MLKRLRIHIIWLFLFAFCAAHAQPAAQPQPQSQVRPHRIFMWKASSPTTTIYLLGSIHVGDSGMYPLPKEVESLFAAAKVLVVEINVKNLDQSKVMATVQQYGLYTGDDNLTNHLSPETAAALNDYCTRHNVPRTGMEKLKPWLVAVTLAAMAWQQAGEDPALGIDVHFLDESKAPQHVDELETMESQFSIFADATPEEQQSMLASVLKQGDKMKEMIQRIQAAYTSGDAEALQKIMDEESDTGSKTLNRKLLDDRNQVMAGKLVTYLQGKDPVFVVVGAAHIIGEKGLAQLLRDKGYKVDQVILETK